LFKKFFIRYELYKHGKMIRIHNMTFCGFAEEKWETNLKHALVYIEEQDPVLKAWQVDRYCIIAFEIQDI
jgi:hypothetical protein